MLTPNQEGVRQGGLFKGMCSLHGLGWGKEELHQAGISGLCRLCPPCNCCTSSALGRQASKKQTRTATEEVHALVL